MRKPAAPHFAPFFRKNECARLYRHPSSHQRDSFAAGIVPPIGPSSYSVAKEQILPGMPSLSFSAACSSFRSSFHDSTVTVQSPRRSFPPFRWRRGKPPLKPRSILAVTIHAEERESPARSSPSPIGQSVSASAMPSGHARRTGNPTPSAIPGSVSSTSPPDAAYARRGCWSARSLSPWQRSTSPVPDPAVLCRMPTRVSPSNFASASAVSSSAPAVSSFSSATSHDRSFPPRSGPTV